MTKTVLHGYLVEALRQLHLPTELAEIVPPSHPTHGDYYSPIALKLGKLQKQNPIELANKLAQQLSVIVPEGISVSVASPGFLNITMSEASLAECVREMIEDKNIVPKEQIGKGESVIIEYSAPNIAKPMGVGHLRSTIIGQSLANIYESLGFSVIRMNHLGDWGTQFGKLIVAFKRWGNIEHYHNDAISHLLELYIRFTNEAEQNPDLEDEARQAFTALEHGDAENMRLWQEFRQLSLANFLQLYNRLGTTIQYHMGESDYRQAIDEVYALLQTSKYVKHQGNALILDLTEAGLPTTILRKADGSSLYLTRDIAQVLYRVKRWQPDKIIYVVGQDQSLYFTQWFTVVKLLGLAPQTALEHVGFGLVTLDGKRMRTREGRTIQLEDVLDEAVARARTIIDQKSRAISETERAEIAELIGVGSVKYNDLSQNRLTNISFNWDKMLSLEGNSAPYLMYTLARSKSVLNKADLRLISTKTENMLNQEKAIARLLMHYQEIIITAYEQNEPHVIATFLYELAKLFNSFYAELPILTAPKDIQPFRLALTQAVATVLADGLQLLGIAYPEKL